MGVSLQVFDPPGVSYSTLGGGLNTGVPPEEVQMSIAIQVAQEAWLSLKLVIGGRRNLQALRSTGQKVTSALLAPVCDGGLRGKAERDIPPEAYRSHQSVKSPCFVDSSKRILR